MRLAHGVEPVVMVGKAGPTPEVVAACSAALDAHELIKVRFQNFKEERHAIGTQIAEQTGAALVQVIGNVAVLYRMQPDPEKRHITLE